MKHYYEVITTLSGYATKIYHYDATGNREIRIWTSGDYDSPGEALDAAAEWMDENDIDASLV